jgi:O-methyltransferase
MRRRHRQDGTAPIHQDVSPTRAVSVAEATILAEVEPLSMISAERLLANMDAVRYAIRRGVPGALVECGVWRGGSVLAMVRTLLELGTTDRDIFLFDTFEGMTKPTMADTSAFDPPALDTWQEHDGGGAWEYLFNAEVFNVDRVRQTLEDTGYPAQRLHFVVGPVEETLPMNAPESIAVLRLDTDWYESTAHELEHLYPRLSPGGVLIIDDYGHWDGARRAVDEYFGDQPILMTRVDYTGRMGVKA